MFQSFMQCERNGWVALIWMAVQNTREKKRKEEKYGKLLISKNYLESLLKACFLPSPGIHCLIGSLNSLLEIDTFSLKYLYILFNYPLKGQVIHINFLQFSQLLPKGSFSTLLACAKLVLCFHHSSLMSGKNTNEKNMWDYSLKVLKAFKKICEAGLCLVLPVISSPVSLLYIAGNSSRFTPK